MADLTKITPLFLLLLLCKKSLCAESESKEVLVESESKDGKLEIIKQIKKVNDDGSYTIGYEADDGSFKIESRDVLGNIKGTYGEILPKPDQPSVVQRIPKTNRTQIYTSSTKRPFYSTTQSTPTSTTALQRLAKLRSQSTTTTEKPNYSEVVNMESEIKTTSKPHIVYPSSTPRILLQGRSTVRSTAATHTQTQKSEGQLIRPEIVTARPTELPLFRRLALKHPLLGDDKHVADGSEVRSNILRRQLSQEKSDFDPQQHVFTLQQALGSDATDVYSGSVTTGTPRPLFTTTSRPRALLSTTTTPTVVSRPTIRYPVNYQRTVLQDLESNTQYAQETTTTEATVNDATPTPVPVVQIPANRANQEPLVAIRHPFQRGTILVPLSQLQGRVVPVDINDNLSQYGRQNEQNTQKPDVEPQPIYVRRLPPPQFRPIPVQVDENGYIRDLQRQPNGQPIPYPVPVPPQKYNDVDNDIDEISPPVSTRDFQKLLHQLILRQTRLERISALTDPRRHPELYQPRYRPVYRPTPVPYYQQNGPVQFLSDDNVQQRQRQYVHISPEQQVAIRQQQRQDQEVYQNGQSYIPMRRVARLLQPGEDQRLENKDEYLPPDVREMLLLRMLQLAINPALPLSEDEMVQGTTPVPQYKKAPVRNVEILGEEPEEKRPVRSKRYREPHMDYYEQ
ncbi:uncharacterized protein LOC100141622 isoform X2 [Tribolium castaneum]|uniref:uncharacterized protein LOC100141622 isoform X2 n=1 Tax=Tribolium castaneum TaxID=7070 RepID=UPI00046C3B86|nr:PREDICTED: uncharacterized protein LOC100141622 isoform X2 [Tribolium castaneum]|eukprot:XP_008201546.1 PREDICTED: uncharacterized protein LOC100141622 isoform X2 [Tribolium castaneum]